MIIIMITMNVRPKKQKEVTCRWQYIFSGVQHKRFSVLLGNLVTETQRMRINNAMETLM